MNADTNPTVLISWRNSEDNQLIWRAAVQRGWSVERIRGTRCPELDGERVVVYLESLFAPHVARQLGLSLLTPSESWIPELPEEYRLREVSIATLGEIPESMFPLFLKPPNEKLFPATVYDNSDALLLDYHPDTTVLAATPVEWAEEFRCFCLDGHVCALSPYLRYGELCQHDQFAASTTELSSAREFAERVLLDSRVEIPRAVVLDVGIIVGRGWAVVEANPAWGSGLYGCNPDEALNVVEQATTKCDDTLD